MNMFVLHNTNRHGIHMMIASVVTRIFGSNETRNILIESIYPDVFKLLSG